MDCSLSGFSVHGDSPGKNSGVGCLASSGVSSNPGIRHVTLIISSPGRQVLYHYCHLGSPFLTCDSCSVVSDSLQPHGLHGILQARILEWVAIPFSRGFFPTQGLNPGLQHCRQILYELSHQGSPRILQWEAFPFSRGSTQLRIEPGSPTVQADSFPAELPGNHPNSLHVVTTKDQIIKQIHRGFSTHPSENLLIIDRHMLQKTNSSAKASLQKTSCFC